jgi:hypothetical protein
VSVLQTAAVIAPIIGGMQAYTYFAFFPSGFSSNLVRMAHKPDRRKIHSRIPPCKKIMTKLKPEIATPKM